MKRYSLLYAAIAVATIFSINTQAQTLNDLVNYSLADPQGNARSMAVGNAMGAVGGNLTTLSTNPAGIAVYRSSEFAFTGSLGVLSNTDKYLGKSTKTISVSPGFDGIGAVISFGLNREKETGLKGLSFGLTYNKIRNFDYNATLSNINDQSSYLDVIVSQANNHNLRPSDFGVDNVWNLHDWRTITAFETYLLADVTDTDGNFLRFEAPLDFGESVTQKQIIKSRGSLGEIALSGGFNIANRFYGGITLGIQFFNRNFNWTYSEESLLKTRLDSFTFEERTREKGGGVNLKLGLIARINDYVRLGAAIHTPTIFNIQNSFQLDTRAARIDLNPMHWEIKAPEARDEYSFYGPFRALGSIALFMGKLGFISADYQFSYFPMTRFSDEAYFDHENSLIVEHIKPTHEVRVGAEFLLGHFALRAGGGFQTSPYGEELWEPYGFQYFAAAGAGVSLGIVYIDLAYRQTIQRGELNLYSFDGLNYSYSRRASGGIAMATVGFRF